MLNKIHAMPQKLKALDAFENEGRSRQLIDVNENDLEYVMRVNSHKSEMKKAISKKVAGAELRIHARNMNAASNARACPRFVELEEEYPKKRLQKIGE